MWLRIGHLLDFAFQVFVTIRRLTRHEQLSSKQCSDFVLRFETRDISVMPADLCCHSNSYSRKKMVHV